MLYIIVGILLFGLLIAVHEWGHFITAKLLGVKVNEFAIGMGPALVSFQKGETQYSLRLLPVGGYCAMEGEDETNDDPRAFSSKAPWRRLVILAAGSFMNFVAGFLLVALLFTAAGSYAVPVIREFAEHGATQEELDRVREQSKSNVILGLESTQAHMSNLGRGALMQGEVLDPDQIIAAYDGVTRSQVRDLAQEIFDFSRASLSAVGRGGAAQDYARRLGRERRPPGDEDEWRFM